eukprot:s1377_g6.t1
MCLRQRQRSILRRERCGFLGKQSLRTLPITGVVCLVLALLFERQSFSSDVSVPAILGFRVVSIACGLTGMLYAELKLVSLLSAVAFNVLSTLHQIPIVLAGVILQHNTVSISSWAGFACCLIGALVYAIARYSDVHEYLCEARLGRGSETPYVVEKYVAPEIVFNATYVHQLLRGGEIDNRSELLFEEVGAAHWPLVPLRPALFNLTYIKSLEAPLFEDEARGIFAEDLQAFLQTPRQPQDTPNFDLEFLTRWARGGAAFASLTPGTCMLSDIPTMCKAINTLQLMLRVEPRCGELLVPYYRQLLPAFNLYFRSTKNIGDSMDYSQRKRENVGELIAETLEILERSGGEDAFINIKYMIPAYESCMLNGH